MLRRYRLKLEQHNMLLEMHILTFRDTTAPCLVNTFTLLLFYSFTLLLFYSFTLLLFYSFTLLLFYSFTLLLFYSFSIEHRTLPLLAPRSTNWANWSLDTIVL